MAKPTPRLMQIAASRTLWSAKCVPRRACSYSAGVSRLLGKPYELSMSLRGRGPEGLARALENASHAGTREHEVVLPRGDAVAHVVPDLVERQIVGAKAVAGVDNVD
eukprot:10155838-Alexandrium_andersonii.AAC.1